MKHKHLVEFAKRAIKKVFEDKSVSQQSTRESLRELQDEIGMLLEALE